MNNIFDIVNPKLFNILTGKSKRTNFELLRAIYFFVSGEDAKPIVLKEELVDYLTDYIKERDFEFFSDDDEELDNKSAREKAISKIRSFKINGWLTEDVTSDFSTYVSLDDSAIIIIDTLTTIIKQEDSAIEYSGFILNIYLLLDSFDYNNATSRLEQVHKSTKDLMNSLRGLNSNIKKYLQKMMDRDDLSANDILSILLDDYQRKIILTVFSNLKAKDNPSKYSDRILNKLKSFFEDFNLVKLVNNYVDTKKITDYSKESLKDVEKKVTDLIRYVIISFEFLFELMEVIDQKNSKFLNSAKSKLLFIINNTQDFEGQIISILKEIRHVPENSDFFNQFNVYSIEQVDENSVYAPRFNKEKQTKIDLIVEEVTIEEKEEAIKDLFKEDEFSKNKINDFILENLGDRNSIRCTDIEVSSYTNLMKLLLIQIYGIEGKVDYKIELDDEDCVMFEHRFRKFVIYRREKNE